MITRSIPPTARAIARNFWALLILWAVARGVFIAHCSASGERVIPCWTQGPLVFTADDLTKLATALGGLGLGGWLGYNTYNPNLRDPRRRPDDDPPSQ